MKSRESDAEHIWHLCMMLMLFHKEIKPKFNLERAIKIALIHDLPEIYAGDTFVFDEKGKRTQKAREHKAARKLFAKLTPSLRREFDALWQEFEEGKTNEAKVVKMMDAINPAIQNLVSDGKTWKKHKVTFEMALNRWRGLADSFNNKMLYDLTLRLLKEARRAKYFHES